MIRLCVLTEGQTEEAFVNLVLTPHLLNVHVGCQVSANCMPQKARDHLRTRKGGWINYEKTKEYVEAHLCRDRGAYITTMFDLYALPKDFPGRAEAAGLTDVYSRVLNLEAAFLHDISQPLRGRFIPYLQLHEYEALILVDPTVLEDDFPDEAGAVRDLDAEIGGCNPELVNDQPHAAPSKRIMKHLRGYEARKVEVGPKAVSRIGLARLRAVCRHFNAWIAQLEGLQPMT